MRKTTLLVAGLVAMASLLLAGCTVTFRVHVDSINDPNMNVGPRYVLLPAMEGISKTDLEFREYSEYLHRALALKGFVPATSVDDADIAIFVRYGLGDPRSESYSYSIPTYGQTGGGTTTYSGTTYGSGGSTYSSGTITQAPTYGVTGVQTYSGTRTSYFRFLTLDAIDLSQYEEGKDIVPAWKTTVTSRGSSSDLRRVFPVLVGASQEHIGTNTGKQVTVKLTETDARVKQVREPQRK